jgi:hypothetical protein
MENQSYYDTCLQPLIEAVEACLDEGLGLGESPNKSLGTELDLDALLRMDQGRADASPEGTGRRRHHVAERSPRETADAAGHGRQHAIPSSRTSAWRHWRSATTWRTRS